MGCIFSLGVNAGDGRGHSIRHMLGPTRPLPRAGARARIVHFGGGAEDAIVLAVHEHGRRLQVRGDTGGPMEFVLNPATARFVVAGVAQGPRLELLGEPSADA